MDTVTVTIRDVVLKVHAEIANDAGWYRQRGCFEERASQLYHVLTHEGFTAFIDVGVNYGYISILAMKANPDLRIYAFEADLNRPGFAGDRFV